ncbi:MAG: xanthine dehydrogenase family protein molybdopterin-binding subunit [Chloroflexi bacterium]|nr:xanthine dehydrogenase family protein molybdopterin-binding subunit [Chloroflexota bacterium]
MATQIIGSTVKRREDPRLITGNGTYTDNMTLPRMAYLTILRSPHAHARIKKIDASKARAMPGVLAVYTGNDLKNGGVNPIPVGWVLPDIKIGPHYPLALDTARYTGDGIAAVVAIDRFTAQDALDLIDVDYEPLPVVVNAEKATQPGAPQLHPEAANNIAFYWKIGGGDVERALAEADGVIKQRLINQRLIPNAIEPRAALADYQPATGQLTLYNTNQNPHIIRLLLALVLGQPEHKLRIASPDVGGGFGSKIYLYADEVIACFASKQLGRPVKWTEERTENYKATIHGRDHVSDVQIAYKKDGTITGLKVKTYANQGAYLSVFAPLVPTFLYGPMLQGPYTIPNVFVEVYGTNTNTTPVDAYRGAGRPEATYLLERMVDLVALELKMDPADVRRKNIIPPFLNGVYQTCMAYAYDSGDYAGNLERALTNAGYVELRKQQAEARKQGKVVGIGISTYTEITGAAPAQVAASLGAAAALVESALVRVFPLGKVQVMTGSHAHGQGHETTFAQIVADQLGLEVEDVEVVHGDTDRIPYGAGTYGSRSQAVGGAAIYVATQRVIEKGKKLAAHMLEAAEADLVFEDGKYSVKGVPSKAVKFTDVALEAYWPRKVPADVELGLEATAVFNPSNFTFPDGTHVAMVEVDPDTGKVTITKYVCVDDVGKVINPMIVEGQIHGGIVQGVGQALWEGAVYDDNGQLLSGSMMDYALPIASYFPKFETSRNETPSPVNPLGAKGAGEAGTVASTAAVANAVMDALKPFGVKHIDMPLTSEKVWRAMNGKL